MNDIDCISYEISCAANALGAVHDAMRNGDSAPEGYLDALYCVYDYLWDKQYTKATGMSIEEYAEFLAGLSDETLTYLISCGNMIASLSEEKQRVAYFFLRALSKSKS